MDILAEVWAVLLVFLLALFKGVAMKFSSEVALKVIKWLLVRTDAELEVWTHYHEKWRNKKIIKLKK